MKTAEFGKPVAAVPQPGRCRICGCTEDNACILLNMGKSGLGDPDGSRACGWADSTRTLCDGPGCVRQAKRELGFPDDGTCRVCGGTHDAALSCNPARLRSVDDYGTGCDEFPS